jgi:spermidine/putrescine transport system permease protein
MGGVHGRGLDGIDTTEPITDPQPAPRAATSSLRERLARGETTRGWLFSIPAVVFLVAFLLLPVGNLALTAFWRTQYFQITRDWNLEQFHDVLAQPGVTTTLFRSIWVGLLIATITIMLAYPVAWFLRFHARRSRVPLLALVVTVLFSSYLVRIYAWRTLMGREGAINWTLQTLGITEEPLLFLFFNRFAVVLTLVHIFLPFVILLLFASLEGVQDDIVEAAGVLGARGYQALGWVVLPIVARGTFAAFIFTFILSAGDWVTPQLVGGTTGTLLGSLVAVQFLPNGDYSRGAALSVVFMLTLGVCVAFLVTVARLGYRVLR